MQVEESGNMILMTLHWAQLVGAKVATPFLKARYRILSQWAEFLIEDSLIPAAQLSTDDFAGVLANQTNLAIKGIEGIAAMGEIADMIGQEKLYITRGARPHRTFRLIDPGAIDCKMGVER